MINVVIDTNVIISSMLSPNGTPSKVVAIILEVDEFNIIYSNEMLKEYKKVLAYRKLNIDTETQHQFLYTIKDAGIVITPAPSSIQMRDETDRVFYDTAKASNSVLITGNKKDYPNESFIMSPSEFISYVGFSGCG